MDPTVGATYGRYWRAPTDDELVPLALVVRGLGLAQLHLVQVEPEVVHQVRGVRVLGLLSKAIPWLNLTRMHDT